MAEERPGSTASTAEARAASGPVLALSAAIALLGAFVWRFVLGLELLGWDSYPMIAAGRVRDLGEFFGTFGEKLMDGRFPHGDYYRPIAHFAFALDHALYGLEPWGYHLTDLVILAASAGLCCAFAARAFGGLAGAAAAGLAWVLHPAHFEVVTAAPRRADALAVLFLLAALVLEAGRKTGRVALGRSLVTACLCALSIGSKETGAVAPVVLFVFAACSTEGGIRARLGAALARTGPALGAVLGMLALRTAVLGGLGGDRNVSLLAGLTDLPATAVFFARELARGPLWASSDAGTSAALVLLAGLVVFAVLLVALARSERGRTSGARLSIGAGAWLVLLWFGVVVAISGVSGLEHAWYSLPALAAWAVACGLVVAAGTRALHAGRTRLGAGALALGTGLVALNAAGAPPLRAAPELSAASALQRTLLERVERELAGARPGDRILIEGFPRRLDATHTDGSARRVYLATYYSLEAYAELTHPELPVRVELPTKASAAARPDVVLVVFVPAERPGAARTPDELDESNEPLR